MDKGLICVGCVLTGVEEESSEGGKAVMLRCSVWRLEVDVRVQSGGLT